MQLSDIDNITTREEAQAFAVEYQQWVVEQGEQGNVDYEMLADWGARLSVLALTFDLWAEFIENGII